MHTSTVHTLILSHCLIVADEREIVRSRIKSIASRVRPDSPGLSDIVRRSEGLHSIWTKIE